MRSDAVLEKVNVVWLCKTLTKKLKKKYFVKVDKDAVCDYDNHWICDCGHWTTGDDNYHVAIEQGLRSVHQDGFYI